MAAKNSADCVALKISKRFKQESKHKSSDKDEGHTGSRHVASGNSSAVCSIRERHRHVCVMSCWLPTKFPLTWSDLTVSGHSDRINAYFELYFGLLINSWPIWDQMLGWLCDTDSVRLISFKNGQTCFCCRKTWRNSGSYLFLRINMVDQLWTL